jgi:hypothetical protein
VLDALLLGWIVGRESLCVCVSECKVRAGKLDLAGSRELTSSMKEGEKERTGVYFSYLGVEMNRIDGYTSPFYLCCLQGRPCRDGSNML